MFFLKELQPQNVLIVILFSKKTFVLVNGKITPDVNKSDFYMV